MGWGGGGEAGRSVPDVAGPSGAPETPGAAPSRPRLFGGLQAEGAKGVLVAVVSTIVVLGLIGWFVVRSPNWPVVRDAFFNAEEFRQTFPEILARFRLNVQYFVIGEVFILAFALVLAVMRSLPGPVFFPLRAMAIVYADVFRGIPTILVIYLLGFGIPALQLPGVPTDPAFWGVVALVLSYSAYVSEVYRAGIETVHPSQVAAARSLGLNRWQSLRFVVIPQAVRRVVPPLLNDFVALQKDSALIAFIVAIPEAFKMAQIRQAADFNFTPYVAAAVIFLAITIPLTRLVDWLLARQRVRRQAGALL